MRYFAGNFSATVGLLVIAALLIGCNRKTEAPLPSVTSAPARPIVVTNEPASGEVLPLITFDGAPLTDAIQALARQSGLKIQFDAKLLNTTGPDGRSIPATQPLVTERWKNLTASQALMALLDNWGWQLVMDSRTKTGMVTTKPPNATPAGQSPLESVSWTNAQDNDEIMSAVRFDAIPLTDAVNALAHQVGFNIQFDPKLLNAVPPPLVTENWKGITARQALARLLKEKGWQLIMDPRSRIGRITAKAPIPTGSP